MYRLEWSHAWTGRVEFPDQAENRLAACAARLNAECAARQLPCLTMPYRAELETQIEALTPWLQGFKHMVILGIGGSALGARALQKAFYPQQDRPGHQGPWIWIADNIDAPGLTSWMDTLAPEETVVVVVSKSGGTIETLSQYFLMHQWLKTALPDSWQDHLIFVTDEKVGYLRQQAQRDGIRALPVPDYLGGRYSVFSAVGLIPAAFMGIDWRALLRGSLSVTAPLATVTAERLRSHPAWQFASWAAKLWSEQYSQLIFFSYIPAWASLGAWFAQLWAESLGKEGKGTMPVPAVGVTDQHSLQQMFLDGPKDKGCLLLTCPALSQGESAGPLFPADIPDKWSWLKGKRFGELLDAECLGTSAALAKHQVPLVRLIASSAGEEAAGAVMGLCMAATLLTGWLMEINPVDQPAVELGKRLACARLGAQGYDEEAAMLQAFLARGQE